MLKIVFFVLLTFTLITPSAFAEVEEINTNQKITLTTDNTAYIEGDVVTISGKVEKIIKGLEVSLQIFYEMSPVGIDQVKVSQEGKFTSTITVGGNLWKNEGQYTIKATYGDTSEQIVIEFFKDTSGEYAKIYEVNIPDGGTFDVEYTMKGGTVTTMGLNQKNLSLEINISTNSDGVLDIRMIRDSIDSVSGNGQDIDFIILIHEENSIVPTQSDYKKIEKDKDYRAISIPIKNGDDKIVIIGTHVVPEFGTIAMIVLAVAIVSIIAVSAKSRLSIMPRI